MRTRGWQGVGVHDGFALGSLTGNWLEVSRSGGGETRVVCAGWCGPVPVTVYAIAAGLRLIQACRLRNPTWRLEAVRSSGLLSRSEGLQGLATHARGRCSIPDDALLGTTWNGRSAHAADGIICTSPRRHAARLLTRDRRLAELAGQLGVELVM
jgi:hypothetical protein